MSTFILGDIHGEAEQLEDVLIKSQINYKEDRLIFVGDVVDRGANPFKCIDILLSFKNLIIIAGNHDRNFLNWLTAGEDIFKNAHGSVVTKFIWALIGDDDRNYYIGKYFNNMRPYYIYKNNLFIHAGIDTKKPLEEQDENVLCWDRTFWHNAMTSKSPINTLEQFKCVYIGHTPTTIFNSTKPMFKNNVWNLDTGCGKGGLLTIMNLETNKFWQA